MAGQEKTLLGEVSLTLNRGESLGILGPTGGGKSLLLKIMAGLVKPQSGQVRLAKVAMTFQKSGLFDSMTAMENLLFALKEGRGISGDKAKETATAMLTEVGLPGAEKLFVSEMSGGMQKRLGIANALVLHPDVVLYDEPTAGLDPISARSITELIKRMREKNQMTLVLVTSQPTEAFELCDHVGLLDQGNFVDVLPTSAFRQSSNPKIREFITGRSSGARV